MYLALKYVHVASALVSLSLFLVRGFWMMAESPRLQTRFARSAPHVIDTILLASAVALALGVRQYPFVHDWLTAKVTALLVYILLGTIALKRGPTRSVRIAAFIAAVAVFVWIVQTARLRAVWMPEI